MTERDHHRSGDPLVDPPHGAELQAKATSVLESVAGEWLNRQGVVAVEVARSRSSDHPVAIRVTVRTILPAGQVPEGELFPSRLDGIPVELVEGGMPAAGH